MVGNYNALFGFIEISSVFGCSFIITWNWKRNLKFWWFLRKDLGQIHQNRSFLNSKLYIFIYKNPFFGEKMIFRILLQFFFFQISEVQQFCEFWWTIKTFLKHLFLDLWKWNSMWKYWIYVSIIWLLSWFFARFSDLVNSNICITKIYWTKSNFLSKLLKEIFFL